MKNNKLKPIQITIFNYIFIILKEKYFCITFNKFYFQITSISQVFANFSKAKLAFTSSISQLSQQQSQIPQLLQNNAVEVLFQLLGDKEQKIVINTLIALVNLCKQSQQAEKEVIDNFDYLKQQLIQTTDNYKIKTYLIKLISLLNINIDKETAEIIVESCNSPHNSLQQEACSAIKYLCQNQDNAITFVDSNAIDVLLQLQSSNFNQVSSQALDAISQLIRQTGEYQKIIQQIQYLSKNQQSFFNLLSSIAEVNQQSCQQLIQQGCLIQIIQGCQQEIIQAWQTLQNISRYCPEEVTQQGIQNLLIEGLENNKYQIVTSSLLITGFLASTSLLKQLIVNDICQRILRIFEVNLDIELIVAAASFAISQLSKHSVEATDIFVKNGILIKFYQIQRENENLKNSVFRSIIQLIKETTSLQDVCSLLYQVTEYDIQQQVLKEIYRILQLNVENRKEFLKNGYLEFINKNFQLQDIDQINKLYSQDVINYCRKDLCDLVEQVQ